MFCISVDPERGSELLKKIVFGVMSNSSGERPVHRIPPTTLRQRDTAAEWCDTCSIERAMRLLSDEHLLAECRVDVYRGSGPGGQKRNKTSNAVRITHVPTGVSVTATESRSLAENRMRALRRLRLKLATDLREPV